MLNDVMLMNLRVYTRAIGFVVLCTRAIGFVGLVNIPDGKEGRRRGLQSLQRDSSFKGVCCGRSCGFMSVTMQPNNGASELDGLYNFW